MIPRITHSRSQLVAYLNEYEDGARTFFVSSDTYPELFTLAFPEVVHKAPNGWRYKKMAYLWFPPNALDDDDIERLEDWRQRFEQYVLIGLNEQIEDHFSDELDFCMALDYRFNPEAGRRTIYGEAEFQLKYRESRTHLKVLKDGLNEALADLPIPAAERDSLLVTYVPAKAAGCNVPRKLAKQVAEELELDLLKAVLTCPKSGLKNVSVDEKIPIWQKLYDDGCVELSESVEGRTIVVIDDLYQSGVTMWMYAKYLKEQGARYVFGLPCVKSLRDTDNQ